MLRRSFARMLPRDRERVTGLWDIRMRFCSLVFDVV